MQLQPDKYYKFMEAMDAELEPKSLATELYGILQAEIFSPPLFAAICSTDLKAAALRIAEYKSLIGPINLDVSSDAETLNIRIVPPSGHAVPFSAIACELVFWLFVARHCTRENIIPHKVGVIKKANKPEAYDALFGCPITKSESWIISFNLLDAQRPFLTRNDLTWSLFKPEIQKQLHQLQANASVAEQIKAVLFEAIPAGYAIVDHVAKKLCLSVRSLQRRLHEEGTKFKTVLNETRQYLAEHYLLDSQVPVSETAFLLGYQDTASFYRAFKSWTGQTPEEFKHTSR